MANNDVITLTGVVIDRLPGAKFKIKLENDQVVTGYLSGKMRTNFIKIIEGDEVDVELSPYDLSKARIVYRNK